MALVENLGKSTVNGPGSRSQLPPRAEIWGVTEHFQAQSPHLQDGHDHEVWGQGRNVNKGLGPSSVRGDHHWPGDIPPLVKVGFREWGRQPSALPHRDDIKITVDGIDIRKFGSQGQQRTCALSLKLSEIKLVENTINDKPILLLDDVLSELDKNRQSDLLDNLLDTQTIITCTGLDEFVKNRFKLNTVYKVTDGSIELITEELDE